MKNFITIIRSEHLILKDVIKEIQLVGPFSEEGQRKLLLAEELLLNHLEKEEMQFYPALHMASQDNPVAQQAIGYMLEQAAGLSLEFLVFFQSVHGGMEKEQLLRNFDRLMLRLLKRVEDEDSFLITIYESLALPD